MTELSVPVSIRTRSGPSSPDDALDTVEIVEVSPCAAPTSVFISYPNETCYDRTIFSKSDLSAGLDITNLKAIDSTNAQLDASLSRQYARRGITNPLKNHLKNTPENHLAVQKAASSTLNSILEMVDESINAVTQASTIISRIFLQISSKPGGFYSDTLLKSLSSLIYRLYTMQELNKQKHSTLDDIRTLYDYSGAQNPKVSTSINFISKPDSVTSIVKHSLSSTPPESLKKALFIFWRFLKSTLQLQIYSHEKYYYVTSVVFLLLDNSSAVLLSDEDLAFVKTTVEKIPYVPLLHELFFSTSKAVASIEQFKAERFSTAVVHPSERLSDLHSQFSDSSRKIASIATSDSSPESIISAVHSSLLLISSTMGLLWEFYSSVLDNPPPEPSTMTCFERSVRCNLPPNDLKALLQLLSLCRELQDLIRSVSHKLSPKLNNALSHEFQHFVQYDLVKTFINIKKGKERLGSTLESLLYAAGDWKEKPNLSMKASRDLKHPDLVQRSAPPSAQLIEFVRIQVQHLINVESEFIVTTSKFLGGSAPIRDKDQGRLKIFIESSENWNSLVSLEQTLQKICDQSQFYFKEVQLDINHVVQFPVRSSLPFILCQYALDNYSQPELTELILYPLSIYNDAAFQSHSPMLFEEIRAEARVCLDSLAVLISEFMFNSFRTFASLRQLPDKLVNSLKSQYARHWPVSQAYRLRTLLQQNQFFLLSQQVSIKTLIAAKVDEQLNSAVDGLFALAKENGIIASLAISHGLDAIKETHRLLREMGLPLMPFTAVTRTAKWENVLISFDSKYFRDTTTHLFRYVVRKYPLFILPHRFLPPKKIALSPETLGKFTIGKILSTALEPSVEFLASGHFSFFVRQISDGAFGILQRMFKEQTQKNFAAFIEKYNGLREKLTRIKNPLPGLSAVKAYSRFENAYKYLSKDDNVMELLSTMMAMGNLLIAAEMLDEAFMTKHLSTNQMQNSLQGVDKAFDEKFQENARLILQGGNNGESLLSTCLIETGKIFSENAASFIETLPMTSSFTKMNGFPAVWSVLDFVYTYSEIMRSQNERGGYAQYGNSVYLWAAAMNIYTGQDSRLKLMSIYEQFDSRQNAEDTETNDGATPRLQRLTSAHKYSTAIFDWGTLFFGPRIKACRGENQ